MQQSITKPPSTAIKQPYVSTNKSVNLHPINPHKVVRPEQLVKEIDIDSKNNALKYRFQLKYLGKEYENVVVPCTPAHEIVVSSSKSKESEKEQILSFIKVENETAFKGFASGRRSALFLDNSNKLIRFKGCGNFSEGFPKKILSSEIIESVGHQFFHTSKRELLLTTEINEILKLELSIDPPANRSLYLHDYPTEELKSLPLVNELPLINKYCCVFETQGDRRVGTHLISALEVLWLELGGHRASDWRPKLEEKQRIEGEEIMELLVNFELLVQPGQTFLEAYGLTALSELYIPLSSAPVLTELEASFAKKKYSEISEKLLSNTDAREKAITVLEKINKKSLFSTIKVILERIGFEMGQIKHSFCKNNINWGFYLDHGLLFHCNAHLNNFLVTQPKTEKESSNFFVLPLDFDLAFTFEEYICIDLGTEEYGKQSSRLFQESLASEFMAMEMSLFGVEVMNFKYGIGDENIIEESEERNGRRMARLSFRDTLVRAFHLGMRGNLDFISEIKKDWDEKIEDVRNLVEACLILSTEFET